MLWENSTVDTKSVQEFLRSADARKPSVGRRVLPGSLVFSRSLLGQVEGLRAGVSYHTRREHYSELPQALATRNVVAEFLRFKIWARENEWGRDVIPDQVATIVREL
jgi:hypothetical protein